MSLDCGLWEEAEYSDETRAHKENMQNEQERPQLGFKPQTFLVWSDSANHCLSVPHEV